MLLLSVLRPTLEYGSEMWESNNSQTAFLESIMLGAKRVLRYSSKTSNKAIWRDMSLEVLQGRCNKCKLMWWYKIKYVFTWSILRCRK